MANYIVGINRNYTEIETPNEVLAVAFAMDRDYEGFASVLNDETGAVSHYKVARTENGQLNISKVEAGTREEYEMSIAASR